jgi:hypothetical protein
MLKWLEMHKDEIKQKFHVDKFEINPYCIVVSSLDMLQKEAYSDFIRLLRLNEPEKIIIKIGKE